MSGASAEAGRAAVLGAVKRALGGAGDDAARQKAVDDRLAASARNLIPARGQVEDGAAVDAFQSEAERIHATVSRVGTLDDVPKAVADYLASQNHPARIRLTPDPWLQSAPWASETALSVDTGKADGADTAGVSHAFGGVAETGSLVFLSGPENPTTVNFLPVTHIAIVRAADISGSYEDAWTRLRAEREEVSDTGTFMPRTVNWITGPSRTADIELTLFLGVHGPKDLHIIVVEDAA